MKNQKIGEGVDMTKVIAKFIFKLPFSIMRKREYGSIPQSMKINSEEVVVYPPAEYGYSLFKEPLWSPDSEKYMGKINDEPVWEANCIPIHVTKKFPTIPISKEDQKALVAVARDVLYRLLTMYRWRGGQVQVNVTNIESLSYDLRYFNTANEIIHIGPDETSGESLLTVKLAPRKVIGWDEICQNLISGSMPELYESLLLDAYSVVFREPRRAVLDAATACEVFIENFCETASKISLKVDPIVYSALQQSKKREGEVLFYFHEMLTYLFGHSLKTEKPDLYEKLYYLCKTNNFVKHEGKCQYKEKGKRGKVKKVNALEAKEFIGAVEKAIEYTRSLG
jgi:hypothetical protein